VSASIRSTAFPSGSGVLGRRSHRTVALGRLDALGDAAGLIDRQIATRSGMPCSRRRPRFALSTCSTRPVSSAGSTRSSEKNSSVGSGAKDLAQAHAWIERDADLVDQAGELSAPDHFSCDAWPCERPQGDRASTRHPQCPCARTSCVAGTARPPRCRGRRAISVAGGLPPGMTEQVTRTCRRGGTEGGQYRRRAPGSAARAPSSLSISAVSVRWSRRRVLARRCSGVLDLRRRLLEGSPRLHGVPRYR
jgi:hypothetical protein